MLSCVSVPCVIPAMSAASAVLKELRSIDSFFNSRDNSSDPTALQRSFGDSILHKLTLIKHLDAGDAAMINEALKESKLGCMQKTRIVNAMEQQIQTAITAASSAAPKAGRGKKTGVALSSSNQQQVQHWWNFFTQPELDLLNNKSKSFNAKLTLVAERGNKCGIPNPSEKSLGWALAFVVLLHYDELPNAQALFAKLQDLKDAWEAERTPWLLEYLQQFPEQPSGLPAAIYEHAYAEEKPVQCPVSGVNRIANLIPLRKNSRLLKEKSASKKPEVKQAFEDNRDVAAGVAHSADVKSEASDKVKVEPVGIKLEPGVGDDEEVLRREYEMKLQKLRESKPTAPAASAMSGSLAVTRNDDGSLKVVSKQESDTQGLVKHEKPEIPVAPTEQDLDPCTLAALKALKDRNAAKKEETKIKKDTGAKPKVAAEKVKQEPAGKPSKKGQNPKKRPASKAGGPPAKIMKRPSAKASSKAEMSDVPRTKIMQSMPKLPADGSNPKPVRYWGGVIYCARKQKAFRALRTRGDNYTETYSAWGGQKPSKKAWKKVVKAIENQKNAA